MRILQLKEIICFIFLLTANEFEMIKHLVIADDDIDDQMLVKEIIEEFSPSTKITCLSDGNKLMDWLRSGNMPDLILLDLNMPIKTGPQCLIEIRSHEKWRMLPVVILTTSRNKKDIDVCYRSGAQLFYSKPWNMDDSRTLIQSILSIEWSSFNSQMDFDIFLQLALENKGVN